jgi:exosortase/archaeosortase family protein
MNIKKEIKDLKKYYSKKEKEIIKNPRKQFTYFILIFVFIYLLLTSLAAPFDLSIKETVGKNAEGFLAFSGATISENGIYEASDGEAVYSFFANEKQIIISSLCTGVLEIIILISAMIASIGITFRNKIIGIINAIILGFVFNTARIWITLSLIMGTNASVFEFAHDFLFRIILFIYIIFVYVIWFYISQNGLEKTKKEILKLIKSKKE